MSRRAPGYAPRAEARAPRAALLAVGDELLAGAHPDLNSPHLAARLAELDLVADRVVVVGDDERAIARELKRLLAGHELVVASGGLGPTLDDVTRHGAARAAGRELVSSRAARKQIEAWYARRRASMPRSNLRQALIPRGAVILGNARGTAPGFRLRVGGAWLVVLPGPPAELEAMLAAEVLPWLARALPSREVEERACLSLFGLSESVFAEGAAEWLARGANPLLGVTVKQGVLVARLKARAPTRRAARALLAEPAAELRARFDEHVYSDREEGVEDALGRELLARERRVALAESCTGGLAAALLTRVPGISAVFEDGFVTYSERAKRERLGVPAATLGTRGVVSAEVARAMAAGAARAAGVDLAVSVTGVAGPSGGTRAHPVGQVWFGVQDGGTCTAHERRFPPASRDFVRALAARTALFLLLRAVRAAPEGG